MPKPSCTYIGMPCPKLVLGTGHERIFLQETCALSPLVLIFYPGDFAPQAMTLLKHFTVEYDKYERAGFKLFGIGNGSDSTRVAFIKQYKIPFPCFHDPKTIVAKAFQVTKKIGHKQIIQPHVFVINTDGKICFDKQGYPKRSEILKSCKPA